MSSSFPTSLDSFTDPTATSKLNSPSHSTQHINTNDAVEKLEAKVGVDSSAVTTSHDYKLTPRVITDTDGATVTFDLSKRGVHTVTLGGNRTLAVSGETTGQVFVIRLVQDATGSRTVTWWSTIKWPSSTAPTLSTTAAAVDTFSFICTGTNTYDGYFVGFNMG